MQLSLWLTRGFTGCTRTLLCLPVNVPGRSVDKSGRLERSGDKLNYIALIAFCGREDRGRRLR